MKSETLGYGRGERLVRHRFWIKDADGYKVYFALNSTKETLTTDDVVNFLTNKLTIIRPFQDKEIDLYEINNSFSSNTRFLSIPSNPEEIKKVFKDKGGYEGLEATFVAIPLLKKYLGDAIFTMEDKNAWVKIFN